MADCKGTVSEEIVEKLVSDRLRDELKSGVQTIQYQINTLMTTNGQSPFVTLFLNLQEGDPYIEENALIIEEVLRQRLEGIKNEKGVFITPAFPKLVYARPLARRLSRNGTWRQSDNVCILLTKPTKEYRHGHSFKDHKPLLVWKD